MSRQSLYIGGNRIPDAKPRLTARSWVKGHLDAVLEKYVLEYSLAPPGRLAVDPETNLQNKVIDFEERDLALEALFFVSDARAQAQMPIGKPASRQAYLFYVNDAASRAASREFGRGHVDLGSVFNSNKLYRKRFLRETYDTIRSQVIPEAGDGVDYAAAVVLGESTYPDLEIPIITNPIVAETIRSELLGSRQ